MKGNAILAQKQPVWWTGYVPRTLDSLRSQCVEELECLGVKADPESLALRRYGSHELRNSWLHVCPGWNWAKSLLTLEDLGVWTFAAGNPRTFWVTGPCESFQWLFAELGAWKYLCAGPHRRLEVGVTNPAWKVVFHCKFAFELLFWNIPTKIICNWFKGKEFWSSVKHVSLKGRCKCLDVLLLETLIHERRVFEVSCNGSRSLISTLAPNLP